MFKLSLSLILLFCSWCSNFALAEDIESTVFEKAFTFNQYSWSKYTNSSRSEFSPGLFDLIADMKGNQTSADRLISSPNRNFRIVRLPLHRNANNSYGLLLIESSLYETGVQRISPEGNLKVGDCFDSVSWSPDSSRFIYCGNTGAYFCNPKTLEKEKYSGFNQETYSCAWSPNRPQFAISGRIIKDNSKTAEIQIYDFSKKKVLHRITTTESVCSTAYSPNGKWLMISDLDGIRVLNVEADYKEHLNFNTTDTPVWSPDSQYLATANRENWSLTIYNINGQVEAKYPVQEPGNITWDADGKKIYCRLGCDKNKYNTVKIGDFSKVKKEVTQVPELKNTTQSLEWMPHEIDTSLTKYGIIDFKGKQVLPNRFHSIDLSKDGDFWVGLFDEKNTKLSPRAMIKVSRDGTTEKLGVPAEYKVIARERNFLIVTNQSLNSKKEGLCTEEGKIILDTRFRSIVYLLPDFIIAINDQNRIETFNCNGEKIKEFPEGVRLHAAGIWGNSRLLRMLSKRHPIVNGYIPVMFSQAQISNTPESTLKKRTHKWFGFYDKSGKEVFPEKQSLETAKSEPEKKYRITGGYGSVGIEDNSGQTLIPNQYEQIEHIGEGLYAIRVKTEKVDTWFIQDFKRNRKISLPKNTTWVSREGCGLIPIRIGGDPGLQLKLEYLPEALWGYISSQSGKLVLKPRYKTASQFQYGLAVVSFIGDGNNLDCGLIDTKGNFAIDPKYSSLKVLGKNRVLTALHQNKFSKLDWMSKPKYARISRENDFQKFTEEYQLMGMTRSTLLNLLGTPYNRPVSFYKDSEEIVYPLYRSHCINEYIGLIIELENDKVKDWYKAGSYWKSKRASEKEASKKPVSPRK